MIKAIEADAGGGIKFHLGLDHALYADIYMRQGNSLLAKEEIMKATMVLQDCGADGCVRKYESEPIDNKAPPGLICSKNPKNNILFLN
jgi:hypothetical protein